MTDPKLKLPPRFTQCDLVDANSARQMIATGQAATLGFDENAWFATAEDGTFLPIRKARRKRLMANWV